MSSYTIELKSVIEQATQYEPGLTTRERIEKGRAKLFDFDYPIFDENYRNVFETHFIRNFYMREIGFETVGLFKFQLETWLIINMPYWNKMFESELIKFDPLKNVDVSRDYNRKKDRNQNDSRDTTQNDVRDTTENVVNDGTSHSVDKQDMTSDTVSNQEHHETGSSQKDESGSVIDDNFSRDVKADTPDTRLALTTEDGQGVLEYASQIEEESNNNKRNTTGSQTSSGKTDSNDSMTSKVTGNSNATGDTTTHSTNDTTGHMKSDTTKNDVYKSEINDIEDYIAHEFGKVGTETYSEMIEKYRSILLRIEKQIFYEMNQLFMLVY